MTRQAGQERRGPPPLPESDGHRSPIVPFAVVACVVVAVFMLYCFVSICDNFGGDIDARSRPSVADNNRRGAGGDVESRVEEAEAQRNSAGKATRSLQSGHSTEAGQSEQPSNVRKSNSNYAGGRRVSQAEAKTDPEEQESIDESRARGESSTADASSNAFFVLGDEKDEMHGLGQSHEASPIPSTSMQNALSGRVAGARERMLRTNGGTVTTEAAVKLGLEWLAKNQREDGLWSLAGPYDDGSPADNVAAATAMALIAFQGAGHTHRGDRDEPFTKVVSRGTRALVAHSSDYDSIRSDLMVGGGYTEAMCTIALCELYGMTRDPTFRSPASLAAKYCVSAQSPGGGWRYSPRQDSDTSVTGWYIMGLQSARMAGLKVPESCFNRVSKYLDQAQSNNGSRYSYQPGVVATRSMTAEALLCRQYLGWRHQDPRLRHGAQFLVANLPDRQSQDVYYWYYATQVCHHMGGDYWKQWNNVMRDLLPSLQIKDGHERGSWNPSNDRWGPQGGRLYVTCMSLYILEVYYRHLPLYREAAVAETP